MPSRIDRELCKRIIRENIETLCRHFFPNGKKVGEEWQLGSLRGEAGRTLNIHLGNDKAGIFQDFATGDHGDFVAAIKLSRNLGFVDAALEIGKALCVNLENPGFQAGARYTTRNSSRPCNWDADYALSESDIKELAAWRGRSIEFCRWAAQNKVIGRRNGLWAFPVYNNGLIVSAHIRHNKNRWEFRPKLKDLGFYLTPLVMGDLASAEKIFSDESQWDLFSILDKLGVQHGEQIAGICTRGAQNGSLIAQITITTELYLIPQNDEPGRAWLEHAAEVLTQAAKIITVPSTYHDVDDWLKALGDITEFIEAIRNAQVRAPKAPRLYIEFHKPSYFINYEPPTDLVLVGDNHIVRGSVFVIGGAPGVGKSRASVSLAIAGALRTPWFGLETLTEFRTMIIQAENGRFRLKLDLIEIDQPELEEYLYICAPPPYGLCFGRDEFKDQLKAANDSFGPHVVLLDPWNAIAHDDRLKDYRESFDIVTEVFNLGSEKGPALGILAHTRKPLPGERASGRALLNLLAGSYVLGSVPRCVFIMQSASDDVDETRVVWTCCKNNDGKLGARTAWVRQNGLFTPVPDFDWKVWDQGKTGKLRLEIILEIIAENGGETAKDFLVKKLEEKGVKQRTAYDWISKAQSYRLIKFDKGKNAFVPV